MLQDPWGMWANVNAVCGGLNRRFLMQDFALEGSYAANDHHLWLLELEHSIQLCLSRSSVVSKVDLHCYPIRLYRTC